jgi:hypothetical protein
MDDIDGESDAPEYDEEAHLDIEGARPPPRAHPKRSYFLHLLICALADLILLLLLLLQISYYAQDFASVTNVIRNPMCLIAIAQPVQTYAPSLSVLIPDGDTLTTAGG